jgi:hypothetical protein
MAISLKHAFQSAVPDDGNPNTVGSNEWNAEHQLTLGPNALVGRGAEAGAAVEVPCTPFARTLLDDADAATARGTLGLGALATLATVGTEQVGNGAVTYAKMQNVSATSRILGRRTAGAGATEECTLSQVLDFIGAAAQGDILYRDASAWARLGAGLNRQKLIARGAGANPVWGGGFETLAAGNIPAASTLDILNIPQHFSMLYLRVDNVSFNTDARQLFVQGSTNNGSSFDTTDTNYSVLLFRNNTAPILVAGASMVAPGDNTLASNTDTFLGVLIFAYQAASEFACPTPLPREAIHAGPYPSGSGKDHQ